MLQTDVVCIYEQFMYDCVNQKDMIICSVAFNPIQARLFYRLKVQGGGSLGTPL